MNILVTGAKGFIGKNLIATLHNIADGKDRSFNMDTDLTIFENDTHIQAHPSLCCMQTSNLHLLFYFPHMGYSRQLEWMMKS